jgi:hypothetical protein
VKNEDFPIAIGNGISRQTEMVEVIIDHPGGMISIDPLRAQILTQKLVEDIKQSVANRTIKLVDPVSNTSIELAAQEAVKALLLLTWSACNAQTLNNVKTYLMDVVELSSDEARRMLLWMRKHEGEMSETPTFGISASSDDPHV